MSIRVRFRVRMRVWVRAAGDFRGTQTDMREET
jgi:hypothetical protein